MLLVDGVGDCVELCWEVVEVPCVVVKDAGEFVASCRVGVGVLCVPLVAAARVGLCYVAGAEVGVALWCMFDFPDDVVFFDWCVSW